MALTTSVRPAVVQQRQGSLIACSAPRPPNGATNILWFQGISSTRRRNTLGGAAAAGAASTATAAASPAAASPSVVPVAEGEREVRPGIWEGYWNWEGYRIRYHRSGDDPTAPAVLCVHG